MATQRTHVVLSQELVRDIDAAVGPRGRSAFLEETARAELNRRWTTSQKASRSGKTKTTPNWPTA